ncbi:hypothetical protein PIB30_098392 [Stylosanthes scabra]|uniref:Uncharacterized protein n=1 Tax=Stylosanthes scabra TaxID=79078 RepID=A0ABU6YX75_9FABA|nr:hypothetical protein [Stylosanthes scabra]
MSDSPSYHRLVQSVNVVVFHFVLSRPSFYSWRLRFPSVVQSFCLPLALFFCSARRCRRVIAAAFPVEIYGV